MAGNKPATARKAAPGRKAKPKSTASSSGKPAARRSAPPAADKRSYLPAEERRRSIIAAAQQVFSRSNLQGARTRDLARAAGVNQATLYSHFGSKEELFIEAVMQPLVDAMQGMYERASSYESAADAGELAMVATASCRMHLASMVDIFPLLTTALFSDPALGKKLYCEHIVPMFAERGKAMRNVVNDSTDPDLLAVLAFGMSFAVAMHRQFTGNEEDLEALAGHIANLSLFGFAEDRYRA